MSEAARGIFDPKVGYVDFRGERLEIRPLVYGKVQTFSRLVRPAIMEFFSGEHPQWLLDDDVMVVELQELHGDELIEAMALAIDRPVEFVAGTADGAELLALARKIVEVNHDFFRRALKAAGLVQRQVQDRSADGESRTAISSSSTPGIQ